MGLILQIETATSVCSVALANDGNVIVVKEVNERNVHAEVITKFIESAINKAGASFNDLDAVALSSGPGSYTGLRIGTSTAKGICFALDKPLIAVDSLTAMAQGVTTIESFIDAENLLLCPMIDARRMEVFTTLFDKFMVQLKPISAEIIDENSFAALLEKNSILFFGDGAEKCRPVLDQSVNAIFLPNFVNSASFLTKLADEKFKEKKFENLALFEPFYLKDFIAGKKKA